MSDPDNEPLAWPGVPDALDPAILGQIAAADAAADDSGAWPADLWRLVQSLGASRWSVPTSHGGAGCDRPTIVSRYVRLAESSLTAAFILTQHDAAARRLAAAAERGVAVAAHWLPRIAAGESFATVGISHLTTSRRRGTRALAATPAEAGGYRLDGAMPWVTAAPAADLFVTGASLDDGAQFLIALPADRPGLRVEPPFALAALQASCTSEILCEGVPVAPADILAGPLAEVLSSPGQGGTGGLETSSLALGLARAALLALAAETTRRDDPSEPVEALAATWSALASDIAAAARGETGCPDASTIRARANSLVLRATQAYLTARKGTGFLRDEPAQRWARQALFFLVWSCPSPVAQAAIRDLAGICSG